MDIIVNLTVGCDIALLSPALLRSGILWALPEAPNLERKWSVTALTCEAHRWVTKEAVLCIDPFIDISCGQRKR